MKGLRALALALCLVALVCGTASAYAQKRVALVIGNGDYQSFSKLTNPVNDAESLRDALISINFDVVFAENATLDVFAAKLIEFNSKAKTADVAIIYYAGHGMQHDGKNYLIPVNANRALSLDDVEIGSKPVDDLVDVLKRSKGVKVLILDACRDDPSEGRTVAFRSMSGDDGERAVGLAAPTDLTTPDNSGMIVAYATLPNKVAADGAGRNSPYNVALVKWIAAPGLTVDTIFHRVAKDVLDATNGRQHPNTFNTMVTDYILNPVGSEWVDWDAVKNSTDIDAKQKFVDLHPDSAHAYQVKHEIEIMRQNLADRTWNQIKDGSDIAALQAFRVGYPDSPHAAEADSKIAALRQKADDEQREAAAWGRAKDATDLATVQQFRASYPNSPHAAEADQKIAALKVEQETRQRAEADWDKVKNGADVAALRAFEKAYPNSPHAGEANDKLASLERANDAQEREAADWARVRDSLDPTKLQEFLDRYPNSPHSAEIAQKIEAQRAEKAWGQVKNSSDIAALQRFKDAYPNSPHGPEADQKIAAAQAKKEEERSARAWDAVKNSSDIAALERFKDAYPNSPHAAEVDQKIAGFHERNEDPWIESIWNHYKDTRDPADLQNFVEMYPNSPHVPDAKKRIDELSRTPPADKAKQDADACDKNSAEVDALARLGSANALKAMGQRSASCPVVIAKIEVALKAIQCKDEGDRVRLKGDDLAALRALRGSLTCDNALADAQATIARLEQAEKERACKEEGDRVRLKGDDLAALRALRGSLTCDGSLADAAAGIARLEQDQARAEQERVAKACADAKREESKIDVYSAGARDQFVSYEKRTECPSVVDDADGKVKEIDERVNSAQVLLRKFGCYMIDPPSDRFDAPTQAAVGRFIKAANVTADASRLTADLVDKMQGYVVPDTGVCPATIPPPAPPSVAAIPPRETAPQRSLIPSKPEPSHSYARPAPKPAFEPKAIPKPAIGPKVVQKPAPTPKPEPQRVAHKTPADSAPAAVPTAAKASNWYVPN